MLRKEKKILLNLRNLNRIFDEDYKKLSDKLESYKLSHNRKGKLLYSLYVFLNTLVDTEPECLHYIDKIERELNCTVRARYHFK